MSGFSTKRIVAAAALAMGLTSTGSQAEPSPASRVYPVPTADKYCLQERNSKGVPSSLVHLIDTKTGDTVLSADFSAVGPAVSVFPKTPWGEVLTDRRASMQNGTLVIDYAKTGHGDRHVCLSGRLPVPAPQPR